MNGIQKRYAIVEADMKWQAGCRVGDSGEGHMMRLSLAGSSAIQKSVVNVVVVV